MRWFRIMLLAKLLGLMPAAHAFAQQNDGFTVSAGYQLLRLEDSVARSRSSGDELFPLDSVIVHGWVADFSAPMNRMLRVVVEGSGGYYTPTQSFLPNTVSIPTRLHAVLGGIRAGTTLGRLSPFIQGLAGAVHAASNGEISGPNINQFLRDVVDDELSRSITRFSVQTGGGMDWRITDRLGLRTGLQYRRLFLDEDDGGNANQLVFSVGVTSF